MLKTYELIKMLMPKLGEEEAKELVYFVEESRGEAATKADLEDQSRAFKTDLEDQSQAFKEGLENQSRVFKEEFQKCATREDLGNQSQTFKKDLESQSRIIRAELELQIQKVKVDLLKWFFGFWITLLIAIILKGWL